MKRLATAAIAVAAILAVIACGGGGNLTPSATSTPANATTTSAATSAPAATYPTTPEAYTKAAINAWAAHDSATLDALEVSGGLLHGLSTTAYNTEFSLAPDNCQGAAGSSYCLYFNKYGDELTLKVENQLLGQAHAIVTAADSTFIPTIFPSDEKEYAGEALSAWMLKNDNRLKLLVLNPPKTSAAIDALGATRGDDWNYCRTDGAMGSLYYLFQRGSQVLAFQFNNTDPDPAPTSGSAAQHRILGITLETSC
jgi:hypothetical protein